MRLFPVLLYEAERRVAGLVPSVPWSLVAPHEAQAMTNHGQQTLEVLASRGGLAPDELVAVLTDRCWRRMPMAEALSELQKLVEAHRAST